MSVHIGVCTFGIVAAEGKESGINPGAIRDQDHIT